MTVNVPISDSGMAKPGSAEPEFDGVTNAVDGPIEIHTLTAISLVHLPFAANGSLSAIEPLQQHWREVDDPAMDRRMIYVDAALGHDFF